MIETKHFVMCDEPDCDGQLGPFDTAKAARDGLRESEWIELVRKGATVGLRCDGHEQPAAAVA